MSTTTPSLQRRVVRFGTLSEILDDAESLASQQITTVGQWSFGQILEHLAMAVNGFFDGFGFKAPWLARTFIAPFIKNSALINPLPAGFKLPKTADRLIPSPDTTVGEGLESLRRAIDRLKSELPTEPHPFFGKMAREEVVALTLRHAELHLSFVVPTGG